MVYEYNVDAETTVKDWQSPRNEGFSKTGDSFVKKIELEDGVLLEARPLIRTTLEVYVTGRWTDGKEAEFRVSIPVEYVAGFEDGIIDEISESVIAEIIEWGDGTDRLESFDFDKIKFPDGTEPEFGFEEKPVFETTVKDDKVIISERAPTTGEQFGRMATGAINTARQVVGGIISGIGSAISGLGKLFGGGK